MTRPNHNNTKWESRQFEIAAHKWIDLSQPDYGVALMNDCKYGHNVEGNVIDINLLRSPNWPDPTADRAQHVFTYSIFPHEGDHIQGKVIQNAYELNVPVDMRAVASHEGTISSQWSFVSIDCENVIVSAVKKAENGKGTIVRMYESYGQKNGAEITFGLDIKQAFLINLIEEDIKELAVNSNAITIAFKPFEIQTIRIL